jgi:glycosyltransferase involved in cell wall biosynthesis
MKILHVSTYAKGGAAAAAIRLHHGLLDAGVDSKMLIRHPVGEMPHKGIVFQAPVPSASKRIGNKITRVLNEFKPKATPAEYDFIVSRNPRLELFSFPESNDDITVTSAYQEADMINLHWVAGFLNYKEFFKKNSKPVVWTLHDMNPFSGGEHYCEPYTGLNNKGEPVERELTATEKDWHTKVEQKKLNALRSVGNIHIVAPSRWLMEESHSSKVLGRFPHLCIPYGLPTDTFKPRNKQFCREILNLPNDKLILLFVADSLGSFRKGYDLLKDALVSFANKDVLLCAVGGNTGINTQASIVELGRINDERMMSIVYSAADAFIIPSLMDNLPNTVLEALACGVPVIGYKVGGIPDMVEDGVNGYLSDKVNVAALANLIDKFLQTHASFNRQRISDVARTKFSLQVQAGAYIHLYKSIMDRTNSSYETTSTQGAV